MLKIVFCIIIVMVTILLLIYVRSRCKNKLLVNGTTAIIIIFYVFLILININFRFNPVSAACANAFVNIDSEWVCMVEVDENQVHVFYEPNTDLYRTVFVEKLLVGYRSDTSVWLYPHRGDKIRTIGSINVEKDGRRFSAFVIKTIDDEVKKIGLVDENGKILESSNVSVGQNVTLAYEYTGHQTCFNCELTAFDEEMNYLYYYGYEHGDNIFSLEEYKWYIYK